MQNVVKFLKKEVSSFSPWVSPTNMYELANFNRQLANLARMLESQEIHACLNEVIVIKGQTLIDYPVNTTLIVKSTLKILDRATPMVEEFYVLDLVGVKLVNADSLCETLKAFHGLLKARWILNTDGHRSENFNNFWNSADADAWHARLTPYVQQYKCITRHRVAFKSRGSRATRKEITASTGEIFDPYAAGILGGTAGGGLRQHGMIKT
ncbi:hypothetical protein FB451DRAFT_1172837 [Mycena latifolia]|nr:hypothetical protein FB451DRAFT_1172837 [Mycena latifolia]